MTRTKIIFGLVLLGMAFGTSSVYAKENNCIMTNNKGVEIAEEGYKNLQNLGFTEKQILYMEQEEYDANKDLQGEVVSEKTMYLKEIDGETLEISEEEYNAPGISLFGMTAGYTETGAKKMTTQIISVDSRYRYKVDLEWKSMPSVRSYDIIGIGMDTNVKMYSSIYFQQTYCYTSGICDNNKVHAYKSTSTGGGASFKLPTDKTINYLASYLYFSVQKNTSATVKTLNAYGDYSHATKTISEANARNYGLTSTGISLNSSITSYYDAIPFAKAVWTGSW